VYAPMQADVAPPVDDDDAMRDLIPLSAVRRMMRGASRDPFLVLSLAVLAPALVTHIIPFCAFYALLPVSFAAVLFACVALTRCYPAPDDVVDRRNRHVVRAVAVRAVLRIVAQVGAVLTLQLAFNYAALTYERGRGYDTTMRVEWSSRSTDCWLEQWRESPARPLMSLMP
jgi:hypothetical protein